MVINSPKYPYLTGLKSENKLKLFQSDYKKCYYNVNQNYPKFYKKTKYLITFS